MDENFICQPCHLSCLSCIGPSDKDCLSCGANKIINELVTSSDITEKIGYCKCTDSSYYMDSVDFTCKNCDPQCLTCSGPG